MTTTDEALVETLARALWCAEPGDPKHWDGKTGNQWAAYMADRKPAFYAKARALLPILARQRNEGIEAAAAVADELGGVRENLAENLAFAAQHTRARTIATAIRALKEPE